MDDPLNVGTYRSSHRDCRTLKQAIQSCRQLDQVADPEGEIIVIKIWRTKSGRTMQDWIFRRRGT